MGGEFLSLRNRICTAPRESVPHLVLEGAVIGKCWHNASRVVTERGGSLVYGWALSGIGPLAMSGSVLLSLYSRWINHIVWADGDGKLWEVTPHSNAVGQDAVHNPTIFVRDDEARFIDASNERCSPRAAVYVAMRPEGEWTADCLCLAERVNGGEQDLWLDRALHSIRQGGFVPATWRVERMHDKIADAWLFAKT
jgi:hypothetical protein